MLPASSQFSRGGSTIHRKRFTPTFNGSDNSIAPKLGAQEGNSMRHLTASIFMLILLGSASGQTKQSPTRPTPAVVIAPVGSGAKLDPVTLTRASLDEKVITLRLSPRVATSIRMPEPVNSVVIGDPERFQAEHSEHEPELVTVKPVSAAPAQTNLLITTTLVHQLNLLLISSGQQSGGTQTVDVLLKYGKPTGGSFLVEDSPLSASLIAETQKLDVSGKPPELASIGPQVTSLAGLIKAAAVDTSSAVDEKSGAVLDKLLDRQKRASLPVLYAQHPGEIDAGPRIKAGVSEVLDQGQDVVVLFSIVNPANHAIEILPPQVQLGGKVKKKWTTAEQLRVIDFRLSTRRLGAGQRADGVVVFERPSFKESNETLFLQVADSGAVDLPALAPIGFGISSFRGGSAHEVR